MFCEKLVLAAIKDGSISTTISLLINNIFSSLPFLQCISVLKLENITQLRSQFIFRLIVLISKSSDRKHYMFYFTYQNAKMFFPNHKSEILLNKNFTPSVAPV